MGEWVAIACAIVLMIVLIKRIHVHDWTRWHEVAWTDGGDVIQERRCRKEGCRRIQRARSMK